MNTKSNNKLRLEDFQMENCMTSWNSCLFRI